MLSLKDILCRLRQNPLLLLALILFAILLAYLFGKWFFIAYLAFLILIGALALLRIVLFILAKLCWKLGADPKGKGSQGHPPSKGVKLPPTIYKRPDPMLYSQSYLMGLGLAVTWDNPDIDVIDPADPSKPAPSHSLTPGKTYQVRARIWNGSTEAPAVNLLVRFYYLSFGIGGARNYIGETLVDLGVKGSPSCPAFAQVPWTTPAAAGHYCLQAELVWADDANPLNNLGQKNVDVKKLNSPNATFEFVLRNTEAVTRTINLRADSYAIPAKLPCSAIAEKGGRRDRYDRHRLAAHPVPEGWQIDYFGQESLRLRPGEEIVAKVKITATDAFVELQAININGFADGALIGGVTLYVHN